MPLRDKDREQDRPAADLLRRSLASPAGAPGSEIDACPDPEILAAYSERSLDADEIAHYELHFSECARCRDQLAALVRAGEPAGATEEERPGKAWIWDWRWLALPVTAALVLAAVLVVRRPAHHPAGQSLVAMNQPAAPPAASSETPPVAREYAPLPTAPASNSRADAGSPARISPNLNSAKSEIALPSNSRMLAKKETPQASNNSPSDKNEYARLDELAKPAAAPKADASARTADAAAPASAQQSVTGAVQSPPPPNISNDAIGGVAAAAPAPAPKSARSEHLSAAVAMNHSFAQTETVMVQGGDATSARTLIRTPDPQILWRFSSGRFVERSSDAGATWRVQWTNASAHLVAGAAPTADSCWLVGRGGMILLTTDGKNWKTVTPPADADFVSVNATDASSATVTTTDDRKFATSDSGRHWTPAP
jgi:hypothetical protein